MNITKEIINDVANDIEHEDKNNTSLNIGELIIEDSNADTISENIAQSAYQDIVAPQIKENEELKRKHKKYILYATFVIIGVNFFIIIAILSVVMYGILFSEKITLDYCSELLSFLKYFISVIFIEFISILFFIVKKVFDTSISDVFKKMFDKWYKTSKK